MTAAENNILSKKIKGSVFNVSAYPSLDDLAQSASKTFAELLQELTGSDIALREPASSMSTWAGAGAAASENSAAFCLSAGGVDADGLICLAPSLASALSNAMLGGEFTLPDGAARPSMIEIELARPFIVELVSRLNGYLQQTVEKGRFSRLKFLRAANSVEEALSEMRPGAIFTIALAAQAGEDKSASAALFSLHLPAAYVEKSGLLQQARQSSSDNGANEEWRAMMQSNVFAMSIDLPVVIGKYTASLSELSRLEVGQVISLAEDACQSLDITLKTGDGPLLLGKGRLGAYKDRKAVKVMSEIAPRQ